MKTLLTLLAFIVASAAFSQSPLNPPVLNGTWIPVRQQIGDTELPPTAFANQKLRIIDSVYHVVAESTDEGLSYYKDGKMDIYGKKGPNTGKHFMAIYKMENDRLVICYNLKGDDYPASFDTRGKPLYFLSVFKKDISN